MEKGILPFVSVGVCEQLVKPAAVVERIEQVYRWLAEGRIIHANPVAMRMAAEDPVFKSHSKAVIIPPLSIAGLRVVGYRIEADGSGPSAPHSTRLVVLMDLETGSPLAIVDEHYNYTLRTAASVAVAAKHLHPEEPVLGVIGAGGVAQAVIRMFNEVLPLKRILVTSRRMESRTALAARLAKEAKCEIVPVDSIADVLAGANLIAAATTTKHVLIDKAAVRPGMLLCALGSFELDPEIYATADKVFVDDWGQTKAAHDMKPLIDAGTFSREKLTGELAEVVAGRLPGRTGKDEVIVVRTEGMASQDLALAHWTYQEAMKQGLVQKLTL
jgi:alanine dehydrogenase